MTLFRTQSDQLTVVFRDRDVRFTQQFDASSKRPAYRCGTGPRPAHHNAYIERWVHSIKHECLDHFIVLGERRLRYLVDEYVDYHHEFWPHQGLGNVPLHGLRLIDEPDQPDSASYIICCSRIGGSAQAL